MDFDVSSFSVCDKRLNLVPPTRSSFMKTVAVIVLAANLTWVLTLFRTFPWLWKPDRQCSQDVSFTVSGFSDPAEGPVVVV